MPRKYRLDYHETGAFSGMILDYIDAHPALKPFYEWPVNIEGIRGAITVRRKFPVNRSLLVQVLKEQYGENATGLQAAHIDLLAGEHTFTVCTAHQPNLFTGHLYFIYKLLHVVRLSRELNLQIPDCRFVPVYYMGSEDADLDELGQVELGGRTYRWSTRQTGAVGRMRVDKELITLMQELAGQLTVQPYGKEWMAMLQNCYQTGITIAEATFRLVNSLFGDYGLLVLQPDNHLLKASFAPVMERELTEQFSAPAVRSVIRGLTERYHVQAAGRELNLFYLDEGIRERIEKETEPAVRWSVIQTDKQWQQDELLRELRDHPERFSPNVILRPVYQEWILPNAAFIGGGGELAYWLELKGVFAAAGVPYPVLVLRNSFLLASSRHAQLLQQLGFGWKDVFAPEQQLLEQLVKRQAGSRLELEEEKQQLEQVYQRMQRSAGAVDSTLDKHVNALYHRALKQVEALEKKMLRAEKRKFTAEQRQVHTLKAGLFPGGRLQERVDNIMGWYALRGKGILDELLEHSGALEHQFTVLASV